MDFIELLKSFGLDMESVANALGVDINTLNNMDHDELLKLLTQQSNWNTAIISSTIVVIAILRKTNTHSDFAWFIIIIRVLHSRNKSTFHLHHSNRSSFRGQSIWSSWEYQSKN